MSDSEQNDLTTIKNPCCVVGCNKEADYEIWHGDRPDDYTFSCHEHIPELMTDAPKHVLYTIKKDILNV